MEKIISKEEFDELMNVEGETMGLTIKQSLGRSLSEEKKERKV